MNIRKHLPNAITLGNLLAGIMGLHFVLAQRDLYAALWCIILAAMLDVFDGSLARLLKVNSPIGKDLDSLADVVSFGVLPSFIMFHILELTLGALPPTGLGIGRLLPPLMGAERFVPFTLALCAALRLARFNNDPEQRDFFKGIPVPAMGLAVVGFAFQAATATEPLGSSWHTMPATILVGSLLFSTLMVSTLPLLSFKLGFKHTWPYWCAMLLPLVALPWLQGLIFPAIILFYVVVSQVYFAFNGKVSS